jgi:glycosyltransferase involved in cell wall biosynthesis
MESNFKIIVSNPSVAPHVRQTVKAYNDAGYLYKLFTSFFDHLDNKFSSFLRKIKPLQKEVSRRAFHELPIERFVSRPIPELLRSVAARVLSPTITDRIWEWSELGFDKWVAGNLNLSTADAVHTYEHAALATLKRAGELSLFGIYEQPSQHHAFFTTIAKQQIALYPELNSAAAELLINAKAAKRNKRRDRELTLASLIICNSTFTKTTLVAGGVDEKKITVIPLAFPEVNPQPKPLRDKKPLVFIYAGNQSLRKASHLLYLAWRKCNFSADEAELWLIGKMLLPETLRSNLPGKVTIKENIPHEEMMALYQKADVFVLPTLADGFGMVITEAMSQGVPVVSSANSCGPDVIEHNKNGWIITAGDVDMLVDQMKWCVANPENVQSCGEAAKIKAAEWQWPQYRQKLAETVFNEWQKFKQAKQSV